MTELQHLASNPGVIDRADPEVAAAMVTKALEESRSWLAVAMQGSDPTPIAEFKAWAATIEEATKQKKLGREIELDAAEMVRRAERGIGVAIRKGQEAGEISSRANSGPVHVPGVRGSVSPSSVPNHGDTKRSPRDFLTAGTTTVETYAMTDASDEQFDEAIAEAKAEGNLSRANVVRKVRHQSDERRRGSWQQTADQVRGLVEQGYTVRQVAKQAGISEDYVRRTAKEFGIELTADKAIGVTRRHDSNRIAQETVNALQGLAMGVELINYDDLHVGDAAHWATSLSESFRALNRFHKEIKEMTQ